MEKQYAGSHLRRVTDKDVPMSNESPLSRSKRTIFAEWVLPVCGLALAVLAVFGNTLFSWADLVPSHPGLDVFNYCAADHAFAFGELGRGNLPLWNPHAFSGNVCLGTFQSALLYPFNLIYLVLPLAKALTLDTMLHVFLKGLFMYAWGRYRGLHPLGAFFAGFLVMFSGTYFLRVFAGHMATCAAFAWAPLIFLAVDATFDQPSLGWCLLGIFAVTMQILAGFPQAVFCTGVAAGMYCTARFVTRERAGDLGECEAGASNVPRVVLFLAAIAIAPLFLSAAQLWPGIATAAEGTLGQGTPFSFASSYSFPPENLLLAFVPGFFGDTLNQGYWGREEKLWEVQFFIGITGLVLAAYGVVRGPRAARRCFLPMFVLLVILAFGKYTPIFRWLYAYAPGFDVFRVPARFMFPATLFVALLAGIGTDRIVEKRARRTRAPLALAALALMLGAAGWWAGHTSTTENLSGLWPRLVDGLGGAQAAGFGQTSDPYAAAASFAQGRLLVACATCLLLAVLLWLSGVSRWAAYAILVLGAVKMFAFVYTYRTDFDLATVGDPKISALYGDTNDEFRIMDLDPNSNRGVTSGAHDILGYDSVILNRYMDFLLYVFREDIPSGQRYSIVTRMMRMLRLRYLLPPQGDEHDIIRVENGLPRFLLVHDFRVMADRDAIFKTIEQADFDPSRTVILEEPPVPPPAPGGRPGNITQLGGDTDHVHLDIQTPVPAILLITDSYSRGWRVLSQAASPPQEDYRILPANYILCAVPLAAGTHHIIVEYSPWAFRAGRAVSLVTLLVFLAAVAYCVRSGAWNKRSCAHAGI